MSTTEHQNLLFVYICMYMCAAQPLILVLSEARVVSDQLRGCILYISHSQNLLLHKLQVSEPVLLPKSQSLSGKWGLHSPPFNRYFFCQVCMYVLVHTYIHGKPVRSISCSSEWFRTYVYVQYLYVRACTYIHILHIFYIDLIIYT